MRAGVRPLPPPLLPGGIEGGRFQAEQRGPHPDPPPSEQGREKSGRRLDARTDYDILLTFEEDCV